MRDVRLTISADAWRGVQKLLHDHQRFLVAKIRWRATRSGSEALVDVAHIMAEVPRGGDRPPLDDFLVIGVENSERLASSAVELMRRVRPQSSQAAITLVLSTTTLGHWDGAVSLEGKIDSLGGFRITGPGPVEVSQQAPLAEHDSTGLFSRLRGAVGETVYQRLRRAVVVQIGASRNGALCAQMLASLGIARLRLCDGDLLQPENLDGMPGVSRGSIGRPKAEAVADTILRARDDLAVTCGNYSVLSPEAAALFGESCDLVVTCVDDDAARVAAGLLAKKMNVAHLDIATSVSNRPTLPHAIIGDSRLFLPRHGCCACTPPLTPEERESILYRLAAPPNTLQRGTMPAWSEQRAGSLITINAATVSAGIGSWLDLLAGTLRTSFWQRLDWIPGEGLRLNSAAVDAAKECPFCKVGEQ
ncbi:ThiF family adenylyltransferase [Anatilimnocola floriformis]|uniref:ThiF family adenylyltransferase n=1 Tax=Anatilimnocola floriformis TaxID=2948575 RepID=UPI0020C3CB91|nr:ThiF family adenylyltransferase [Anatilimnocola floriformis]